MTTGAARADFRDVRLLARVGVILAFVVPPALARRGPVVCLFRRITGRPCPYCGLTRSWTATAHGQIDDGFRAHPMGPPALLAAVGLAILPDSSIDELRPWMRSIGPIVAAAWVATWLVRLVRRAGES